MRKYIGTSTISKKTKNTNRSRLRKLPITPASSSSSQARYGFSSWCGSAPRIDSGNSTPGEHDEEQRDAVDAEVPRDAPLLDPRALRLRTGSRRRRSRTRPAARCSARPVTHAGQQGDELDQLGPAPAAATATKPTTGTRMSAVRIGNTGVPSTGSPSRRRTRRAAATTPMPMIAGVAADVAGLALAQLAGGARTDAGTVDGPVDDVRVEPRRRLERPGPARP